MEIGKTAISSSSSSCFFKRPTAPLAGPETMIRSPNGFTLPCAGPFHKINAGYEATTTTVNSSCLMYGYLLRRHFTKLTRAKAQRYACTHACICAVAAFIHVRARVAAYIIAAFIHEPRKICGTSVKIIQLNEYGCRDAPCEKSWKQGNP